MPTSNTACFQSFLNVLSRRFPKQEILLVLDGAPNHCSGDLAVPRNITLQFLPPYAPELNPKENLWDEIREKVFKNYALKSIDAVHVKLNEEVIWEYAGFVYLIAPAANKARQLGHDHR
jgi:transposase